MFHCNGWCFTWGVTAVGGNPRLPAPGRPGRIWQLIEAEGVTHSRRARPSHRRSPTTPCANAADAPVDRRRWPPRRPRPTSSPRCEALGRDPHVYGLTETYGPHTVCEWQPEWDDSRRASRRAQGPPGSGYVIAETCAWWTSDMQDVPPDGETMGEVMMRGNNVMKGYFERPGGDREAFRGGWFHSGDLAVMHPDGYIELRDRKKDIIISGGENISTIEVEQASWPAPGRAGVRGGRDPGRASGARGPRRS